MSRHRKHLIVLAALVGGVIPIGAAAALADSGPSTATPATPTTSAGPRTKEAPDPAGDTDNVQAGDQSGDTSGAGEADHPAEATAPDTDSVQSGDQSGDQSVDQSGPDTPGTTGAASAPTAAQ